MAYLHSAIHWVINLFNPLENAWSCTVWIILIASLFRKNPRERWQDFVTILGYVGYCGVAIQLQTLLTLFLPHTLDPVFLRADHFLGFDPTRFASSFAAHKNVMFVLTTVYFILP